MTDINSNILLPNKLDSDSVDTAMGYMGDNIGNLTIEQTRRLVASLAKTESFGGNTNAEEINAKRRTTARPARQKPQQRHPASFATNASKRT